MCIGHPSVMIASDAIPYTPDGQGHPRTAGCYCRVLGKYVREKQLLSLHDAIRKMTILPARRLEKMSAAFRKKGRLQEGADADLTVFDPSNVTDNATFKEPMLPSSGVQHVLVLGVQVVCNGQLVNDGVNLTPGIGYKSNQSIDKSNS